VLCVAALLLLVWRGSPGLSAAGRIGSDGHAALAASAARVLETYCARCHQAGGLSPEARSSLFLNILDLETLARDPSLVRPGLPDGSRLYTAMLRRSMPPDAEGVDGTWTGPAADDIQAVRDWIEALPARPAGDCPRGAASTSQRVEIAAALWRLDSATAAASRFITLSHLDTPCADSHEMAKQRDALRRLVAYLSRKQPRATPVPIDDRETVFRVSLDALGWTPADWEHLGAGDAQDSSLYAPEGFEVATRVTGSRMPVVRGEWLAHAVLRGLIPLQDGLPDDEDGGIAALARAWERHVDLEAAAAEMAIDRGKLVRLLESAPASASQLARRLLHGLLSRDEFVQLRAAMLHEDEVPIPAPPPHQTREELQQLELAIWSGKLAYAKGELLTLHAWSNADCHLTLIGLDREGRATVLFPNELEPDNRLTAGQVLTVPGAAAAYQFRLADEGRERVVGVCTVNAGLADGIEPDYERQRFTMLGDWRAFLFEAWSKDGAAAAPRGRQTRSARRRGKQREAMKVERPSPEHHARTAITFEVR